jgi:hypothetical protein
VVLCAYETLADLKDETKPRRESELTSLPVLPPYRYALPLCFQTVEVLAYEVVINDDQKVR